METREQLGGCMAGFFNMFDLLSPKRLSSDPTISPLNHKQLSVLDHPSPTQGSPWRFSKKVHRLSLDSKAFVDAKGSLKPRHAGSPSVIARLMGLEPLPTTAHPLQRSASESRVTKDYRFVDSLNFSSDEKRSKGGGDPTKFHIRSSRALQRPVVKRNSFFDPADFFPESRQCGGFSTDLETRKQLLEALRLKGLLHSFNKPLSKNLVFDYHESPIRSSSIRRRAGDQSWISPNRSENSAKSPNMFKEQRQRKVLWRRPEHVQTRPMQAEEMWKMDEYKRQGKTILERCDKLLHSIAEMTTATEAGESQPSPVSVLDASFYHNESSPSPVMKRTLDFGESEDESWDSISSSSDFEYVYISDILRASDCLPQESDIFSLVEKQQYLKGKCVSRAAAQERRLIFDVVQEIVGRRRRLPPWKMVGEADKTQVIWSEFQKMRKKRSSREEEDMVGYVCGVVGKDLSEDRWPDCLVEISKAVLDIERLVFKDVICETIQDMAALNRSGLLRMRRRLLF